jgi:Transglycosylase SLT domain
MQSITFCSQCRGMKIGWNRRYMVHCLRCKEWLSKSSKLLVITVFVSALILSFSTPSAFVFSDQNPDQPIHEPSVQEVSPVVHLEDPSLGAINKVLDTYKVDGQRNRIAAAIVSSGRKYNVDPLLIASIMIVESRANPFAISGSDAIGIMQIHLPTWGQKAEKEGINLFKIEDNVEFGVRILKDYVRQFGLWDGVKRYKGWNPEDPGSAESVMDYVAKVQRIYTTQKS